MSVTVILNPAAARGGGLKFKARIEEFITRYLGKYSIEITKHPGHATILARDALKNGQDIIVAAGGDGTVNEVVNGFFEGESAINPHARLGIFPIGMGNDFAKSVADISNLEAAARCIAEGKSKFIDIGSVEYEDGEAKTVERKFINIADFGLSSEVASWVNSHKNIKTGTLAYFFGIIAAWRSHIAHEVRIKVDGEERGIFKVHLGIVCNGSTFGGGMKVAPMAKLDDGLFEIYFAKDVRLTKLLSKLPSVYRGKHLEDEDIMYFRGTSVEVYPIEKEKILMAMEGEQPGFLPAKYRILPKALRICV